ncbi:hypothetical protein HPP92_022297 [Vanilla planifolia]|uniref:Thaumatin-like protein n=1 Tax=Vanilla planifolia TaxID=51239 RepID=A0A835PT19_VANPL|nr:hypothetical protein HPP92_022297 [Vanilla planifolia]
MGPSFVLVILHMTGLILGGAATTTFTFSNNCTFPVWIGTLSGGGSSELTKTGFPLPPGSNSSLSASAGWSGRFWGRSFCSSDSSGRFSCLTGDCSTGQVSCNGEGGAPPATLVEVTLASSGGSGAAGKDFYDVSLVDGYNLPVSVEPAGGSGDDCRPAGCRWDLNVRCPKELAVAAADGTVVACRSACEAFGDARTAARGVRLAGDVRTDEIFEALQKRLPGGVQLRV